MELDPQLIFNGLLVIGCGVVSLLIGILRESLKVLRVQVRDLESKINAHLLEVATTHVTRTELDSLAVRIFAKLDEHRKEQRDDIRDLVLKMEAKADK